MPLFTFLVKSRSDAYFQREDCVLDGWGFGAFVPSGPGPGRLLMKHTTYPEPTHSCEAFNDSTSVRALSTPTQALDHLPSSPLVLPGT